MATPGAPALPITFRELLAETSTAEQCRQWLMQYGLLAAQMQCSCGSPCILQAYTRSTDGKVRSSYGKVAFNEPVSWH